MEELEECEDAILLGVKVTVVTNVGENCVSCLASKSSLPNDLQEQTRVRRLFYGRQQSLVESRVDLW